MDELILQTLSGNATPSVQEQVRRWRAESPENEATFRDIALVWSATAPEPVAEVGGVRESGAVLESGATAGVPPVDPRIIIAQADRRRAEEGSGPGATGFEDEDTRSAATPASTGKRTTARPPIVSLRERRDRIRKKPPMVLLRGLAIAAGLAAVALTARLLTLDGIVQPPAVTFAANAAGPRTVVLDDGSFVRLAAASALEVRNTESERDVNLTGRAFFAVAHDAARPFVVRAGAVETRVLGTRFEVAETEGLVRTVVIDGRVAVSNAQGAVEVEAGSVARAVAGDAPVAEQPEDVRALLDWPGGLLLFQGTPLDRVAEEVERFFGRSVTVKSAPLQALRISGSFEQESFEEVVQGLCDAAGAVCALTADGAVISPAGV